MSKLRQSHILILSLLFLSQPLNAQSISVGLINDASQVLSGGKRRQFSNRTLAILAIDYKISDSWLLYADAQLKDGDNGSQNTGDLQAYSNIDEADFSRLFEIWVQKDFADIGLRIKVGQVDANSEFAFVPHSDAFINSSMGFSPTITVMPTYPLPRLSVNAFYQAKKNTQVAIGIYADESNKLDEVFSITQATHKFAGFDDLQLTAGVWHKTGGLESFSDGNAVSGLGYYATLSGTLHFPLFDSRNAGWFSQFGYSDAMRNPIDLHASIGAQWYGVNNQESDIFGLALTHISTSEFLQVNPVNNLAVNELQDHTIGLAKTETSIETFYRLQVNEFIAVKPNLQYIISPASEAKINNALVVTIRTEITF